MGTWQFTPDTLNRLVAGAPAAGSKSNGGLNLCWSYDSFGNRTAQSSQSAACPSLPSVPTATAAYNASNQVTWAQNVAPAGFQYDQAGNVTYDGVNKYFYDTDGRICAVSQNIPVLGTTVMTGYLYDAEGRRIAKGTITNWGSCDPAVNGFQVMTEHDYILDLGGEQFTEMVMDANNSMGWQHTNVWAGGKLLATYDNDGLHFYFDDPLGTRRAQTDYAGVIEKTCASLPYGDGETCQPTPTEHLFTGKERDSESGNDYFGARYYASSMGRFMSPDEPFVGQHPYDPQSWNLYSYGLNNPTSNTDDDGHDVNVCDSDGHCHEMSNDEYQAAQRGNNGGLNVPSLDSVGTNGSGNITDSSGKVVGTATYVSDGNLDPFTQASGFALLGVCLSKAEILAKTG